MTENKFTFSVGSDLDYEDLVADIGCDNQLLALLSQEGGFQNIIIKIFPKEGGGEWELRLGDFERVVQKAKQRLWELRKSPDEEKKTP